MKSERDITSPRLTTHQVLFMFCSAPATVDAMVPPTDGNHADVELRFHGDQPALAFSKKTAQQSFTLDTFVKNVAKRAGVPDGVKARDATFSLKSIATSEEINVNGSELIELCTQKNKDAGDEVMPGIVAPLLVSSVNNVAPSGAAGKQGQCDRGFKRNQSTTSDSLWKHMQRCWPQMTSTLRARLSGFVKREGALKNLLDEKITPNACYLLDSHIKALRTTVSVASEQVSHAVR